MFKSSYNHSTSVVPHKIVKLSSRSRSGEGQVRVRKVKETKDLDLSYTLFWFFFFFGFREVWVVSAEVKEEYMTLKVSKHTAHNSHLKTEPRDS